MNKGKKVPVSVDTIKADLPNVLTEARKLLDRKGAVGILTMVFYENGDVLEVSDSRLINLYQIVGSLEMIKHRYLRGPQK